MFCKKVNYPSSAVGVHVVSAWLAINIRYFGNNVVCLAEKLFCLKTAANFEQNNACYNTSIVED